MSLNNQILELANEEGLKRICEAVNTKHTEKYVEISNI